MTAYVRHDTEAFVRGIVEVVLIAGEGGPQPFLERVEPMLGLEDGRPVITGWLNRQIPVGRDELTVQPEDATALRIPRHHVRDVAVALLRYADQDAGGPPGDAFALRRDLERERDRGDRLEAALLEVTARLTPIVTGEHALVPKKA